MLLTNLDRPPMCAVCKKPAQEMVTWYDHERRATMVVVRCHGSEEVVGLTDQIVMAADAVVSMGEAFAGEVHPGLAAGTGEDLTTAR